MPATLNTAEVAKDLGLSYRQVDYLTRNGTIVDRRITVGSGNRARWPHDIVVRLHVAKALYAVAPWLGWPSCVRAVLATDVLPPPRSLVVLRPDGSLTYVDAPMSLIDALEDGGVVANYTLPHAE